MTDEHRQLTRKPESTFEKLVLVSPGCWLPSGTWTWADRKLLLSCPFPARHSSTRQGRGPCVVEMTVEMLGKSCRGDVSGDLATSIGRLICGRRGTSNGFPAGRRVEEDKGCSSQKAPSVEQVALPGVFGMTAGEDKEKSQQAVMPPVC